MRQTVHPLRWLTIFILLPQLFLGACAGGGGAQTTRKPGNKVEGYAQLGYDLEDMEGFTGEGAVSIPILDNLRSRFAVRYEDVDGWVKNTATGREDPTAENITVRGVFDWDITEQFTTELLVQYGDMERNGRQRELTNCVGEATSATPLNPGEDCLFNNRRQVDFLQNGEPLDEAHDTDYHLVGLTLNYSFERFDLSYLFNYSNYTQTSAFDSDFAPTEVNALFVGDEWDQYGHELRFATTDNNTVDLIGGLYYSNQENAFSQGGVNCRGPAANCLGGLTNPIFAMNAWTQNSVGIQDTESFAVFAQADWHVTEQFTLTVGGRWSDEDKTLSEISYVALPYEFDLTDPSILMDCPDVIGEWTEGVALNTFAAAAGCLGLGVTPSSIYQVERSESDFTPNAGLRWQPNEDHTLYVSYGEGFKSGGFGFSNGALARPAAMVGPAPVNNTVFTAENLDYDGEQTTHYEIGGKHVLLDGRLQLNWAAWMTDFENIQVSALEVDSFGNIRQQTTNAAEASSDGIELDFVWAAHENINLYGAVAYLDAKFNDFTTAPCFFGQATFGTGCVGGAQDVSGRPMPYAPDWSFNIGARGMLQVADAWRVNYNVIYVWKDDQFFEINYDPLDAQESYGKLDASLGFGPADSSWVLSVIGKNLTDKLTANSGNTSRALGQPGDRTFPAPGDLPKFLLTEPKRQIAVQFRYNFE